MNANTSSSWLHLTAAISELTAKGFDTDLAFLAVEIDGDTLYYNAISRLGQVIDSGTSKPRP